jgi:hypothetical protein
VHQLTARENRKAKHADAPEHCPTEKQGHFLLTAWPLTE